MAGAYWKVSCTLPQSVALAMEGAFDGLSMSVAAFEADEKDRLWTIDLLCAAPPDMDEIRRRLIVLSALHNVPVPEIRMEQLKQRDWLGEVAKTFPPFVIGRFYVHGAHVGKKRVPGKLSIQIDAGGAFGSGEHGTTAACLEALDWLAKKRDFANVLDMGCGSGILAIAAYKLWRGEVLAADIDKVAVRVTRENAGLNRAEVAAVVSDGYRAEEIRRRGPFDLILSNILARPLVAFAPALARHLKEGGVAVLSGLLDSQEQQVRRAHAGQGLIFRRRFVHGQWHTLVFQKRAPANEAATDENNMLV